MSLQSPQSKRLLVTLAMELEPDAAGLEDVRTSLQTLGERFQAASIKVVESRAHRRPRPPRPVRVSTGCLHSYE